MGRDFTMLKDLAETLEEFRQCCNVQWLLGKLTLQSRQQARERQLASRGCCMTMIQKFPRNRVPYNGLRSSGGNANDFFTFATGGAATPRFEQQMLSWPSVPNLAANLSERQP